MISNSVYIYYVYIYFSMFMFFNIWLVLCHPSKQWLSILSTLGNCGIQQCCWIQQPVLLNSMTLLNTTIYFLLLHLPNSPFTKSYLPARFSFELSILEVWNKSMTVPIIFILVCNAFVKYTIIMFSGWYFYL